MATATATRSRAAATKSKATTKHRRKPQAPAAGGGERKTPHVYVNLTGKGELVRMPDNAKDSLEDLRMQANKLLTESCGGSGPEFTFGQFTGAAAVAGAKGIVDGLRRMVKDRKGKVVSGIVVQPG